MSNPPDEVLDLPPAALLAWVQQRINGELEASASFNWHGMAQVAAMNARVQETSAIWAEIAILVYSWLAQRSEPRIAASFRLSEMHVRAHQISLFGALSGHAIRDPQLLVTWFRGSCGLSYSQATTKSAIWQQLPIEEIAQLRSIKNHLGVFANLLVHLSPADRNELLDWLALRPNLP